MTHLGRGFGTASRRAGMERGLLGGLVEVVRLHGGHQQGDRIRGRQVRRLAGQPVQPVVVEVARCAPPAGRAGSAGRSGWWCRLRPPTVVSSNARRRRARASARSLPHATILAIIESKSAGIRSPSRTPASTRMPAPAGRRSRVSRPGAGVNAFSGSSAYQPRLDRVPGHLRRRAGEPAALRDVQLQLHQVQPGGRLGHRVLDLQPGVDLHEQEAPGVRVDQELHGARVAVARRGGQPDAPRRGSPAPPSASSTVDADSSSTFWWRRCKRAVPNARPPTRCRSRRRSPAPRRGGRPARASRGRPWGRRRPAAPRRAPTAAPRRVRRRRGPSGSRARRRRRPP